MSNFFSTGLPWTSTASPLPVREFVERRDKVAQALVKDNVEALVLEPGYHFQYLANVSQKDWEVWEASDRFFETFF